MSSLLAPNDILALPNQAVRRILESRNGDCALLYLAMLANNGDGGLAWKDLKWDRIRFRETARQLVEMDLMRPEQAPVGSLELPPGEAELAAANPPEYSRADLATALKDGEEFRILSEAVDVQLGRKLGPSDLAALYTIYDFIGLPPAVIFTLIQWCVSETQRKFGEGRFPRMSEIKRQAFIWKREGLVTDQRVEEFLRQQQELCSREREILTIIGARNRAPVERERRYIAAWIGMGFPNETIKLAHEQTLFQKQNMNWYYMNSILKRWHQAGYHTVEQVKAGESRRLRVARKPSAPRPNENYQPTAERIKQNDDWLDEFLRRQESGHGV